MNESLFNGKVSISTPTSIINAKIDIIKLDTSVEIRLIDTSNIFTLFTCHISQSDFYILKRDQDILVDFDRFIHVLVNLFHNLSTNRLSAYFSDGKLRFMENNEFRNICKLELKFTKPEETQYKRYLADLLSRMENDNVKLIKENGILRDKCVNGDRDLKERLRYCESEIQEYKRRIEMVSKENEMLESRVRGKEEEASRISSKIYGIEEENTGLKLELEKYQKENKMSYKEQAEAKEDELQEMVKELKTAREIIIQLKKENDAYKEEKRGHQLNAKQEIEKYSDISDKYESVLRKQKTAEEKYKTAKMELKEKTKELEELALINKSLSKRLENAQNVYNHFYSKKVDDTGDAYSDTFSLRPESPPPR
ncbi:spindle assembly abnormal protein 6 [Enteropsectra breve]|nr:spindle assembly abnormal protein 6 [Enteropsectra breve]